MASLWQARRSANESARPRRIAASRGLALRGGSGRRAFAPSGPVTSPGFSAEKDISSSGWRASARVQDASDRLNGSFAPSAFWPAGLRLVGLTSTVDIARRLRGLFFGAGNAYRLAAELAASREHYFAHFGDVRSISRFCTPAPKSPPMNAPAFPTPDFAVPVEFLACLNDQRAAFLKAPEPAYEERLADLNGLARLIVENRAAIVAAINDDYGSRSELETLFAEVYPILDGIRDARKRLKGWMRPRRRGVDRLTFPGARNRVIPQPLGVVGVIVPWNFPLMLSFSPLVSIFAAGNRAMVKMSENSQAVAELLIEITPKYFPTEKLAFFADGGGRGPAFSSLPFDHLIFTGSGTTGRAVMASAARNLTPVTLELGGKSPAVVAPDFPVKTAAQRILWGKTFNAGQVCLAVDHVFLPRGAEEVFVDECRRLFAKRYPDINGPDFTSIIDERSHHRLSAALDDARAKGARLVNLAAGQAPDAEKRKFPPHLVLNPTPEMELMRREIFGPILPVRLYGDREEVVDAINAGDRPLAIYPFTNDAATRDFYISKTRSGGVAVNEPILHVAQHDLPFGGVGASGMGHYHGREGFDTFSKLRPVFEQGRMSAVQRFLQPPYRGLARRAVDLMIWMKR